MLPLVAAARVFVLCWLYFHLLILGLSSCGVGEDRMVVVAIIIVAIDVIIATIIFFNVFAPVYVLTASAQGAPAYDLKVVISEIYANAFVFYRMGYAGAQSVVLLCFVLTLVLIQLLLFRDRRGERG